MNTLYQTNERGIRVWSKKTYFWSLTRRSIHILRPLQIVCQYELFNHVRRICIMKCRYVWSMCDLDSSVILAMWKLCFITHTISNHFAAHELPSSKMKEELALRNVKFRQILRILSPLTFDSNVISIIWIASRHLHPIGRYEHPRSNNEHGVRISSRKTVFDRC